MIHFIKEKLERSGIDVYDTPKVLVTYGLLNKVLYGGLVVLCYKRQPFFRFCKRYNVERMITNKFPKIYAKSKKYYTKKVNKISKSKFYSSVTRFFGLDPKKTINGVAEASILYKLLLPISFPVLLYGSMYPYRKTPSSIIPEITLKESKQKKDTKKTQDN